MVDIREVFVESSEDAESNGITVISVSTVYHDSNSSWGTWSADPLVYSLTRAARIYHIIVLKLFG